MALLDMIKVAERHGCYWKLQNDSLVFSRYLCDLFSFRRLVVLASSYGNTPEEAFSNALIAAKLVDSTSPQDKGAVGHP